MSRSEAELRALAARAALGAGVPPAQAAQFGRAAAEHLAHGRDPCDLSRALNAGAEGPILWFPLSLRQVLSNPDTGARIEGRFDVLDQPELAVSYVGTLPWLVSGIRIDGDQLCLTIEPGHPRALRPPVRLDPPAQLTVLMQDLAVLTYVPESEASRSGGAGAGLTDND